MNTFVEYSKAIGSLAFGLMIGVWVVMIAVPEYADKLPSLSAQAVDQSDISVSLGLNASSQTQLWSGDRVRFDLSIQNIIVQGQWESYLDTSIVLQVPQWLVYDSISQDQFVINTTPSQQWSTYTFQYLDPMGRWETDTFTIDFTAIDVWSHQLQVEVIHPNTTSESNPFVPWCRSSNNTSCQTVEIIQEIQPVCNTQLSSMSIYENWSINDDTFRNLPACEEWNFWNPSPTPWDATATNTQFTFDCIVTWQTPVSCSLARRFCGDSVIDSSDGEACDTNDVDGLACDSQTCQILWCTNPEAYNFEPAATQELDCRAMGDGIVDFNDGEACDDGNTESWDGCSQDWQIESGYTCPLWGQPCQDIDECQQASVCGDNSACTNTIGSYTCTCNVWYNSPDGANCTDINECVVWTDTCSDNAVCTNTDGWFDCVCSPWYTGDWETCADIDECQSWTDLCVDIWVCTNTTGGYECGCLVWYHNQMNPQWSSTVNTCLEIDECTGQVEDPNGWYRTIPESDGYDQWASCTSLWWICTNEIGGVPWYACDCPQGYLADGQWVCQVVYGDGFIVSWEEQCDTWVLWVDDGCSDLWVLEVPSCDSIVTPLTWSVWTTVELSLGWPLSSWENAVLIERWDGTIIQDPVFPVSTSYTAWQQYTITITVENALDTTVLWTCEAIIAIDTECGNAILEPWELCDMGSGNGIMCSAWYGETCEYCTSTCTYAMIEWASCGDAIIDSEGADGELWTDDDEACDDWEQNWELCNWTPWSTCQYCTTTCQVEDYTIPVRSWWSSSSISVSVSNTTDGITTQMTHWSANDNSQEEENKEVIDMNESQKDSENADQQFEALISWLLADDDWSMSTWNDTMPVLTLSIEEIFLHPVQKLTPESLSDILYTITRSNKDEIRTALQRYLEMKEQ